MLFTTAPEKNQNFLWFENYRVETEDTVFFFVFALFYSARPTAALRGVLWTAATTTTACNRLPSLVMLCEVDDEDEEPFGRWFPMMEWL